MSRFYSALFSTLLIPLLFFLGRSIKDEKAGFIAAILAATSVGFIQFAHFGTFEMWLTMFSILLYWCCIEIAQNRKHSYIYLFAAAAVFGVLIATKVSSVVLLPFPLLAVLIRYIPKHKGKKLKAWMIMRGLAHVVKDISVFAILALLLYFFTNPYTNLDPKAFSDSMNYESGVALGSIPVFYTAEFYNTVPVAFQLSNVFPFLLNPLIFLLALPSFVFVFILAKKTKHIPYLFLVLFFLMLLFSQAVLFVKWTRYMVPTLPFLYLMIAITLSTILAKYKTPSKNYYPVALIIFLAANFVFAVSYFITAFVHQDTRIAAAAYASKTIPRDTYILSEVYDLGITAFNSSFDHIELYNTYDLDLDPYPVKYTEETLKTSLENSDYIILPSQRVIKSRLLQKKRFPKAYKFYKDLFNGNLGYEKVYETPCDIYCQITYMGNPSFRYEQTANVFDRPTVYIFKKK